MKLRLVIVVFLVFALIVPVQMLAQAAKTEIYSIDTMTLTDKQFLTGAKDGNPARIAGELRLPSGSGPFPAVVLVHGSGGVGVNVDLWGRELNGIGIAAFLLDSFTGRGLGQTITDQSQIGQLNMIYDAYRALDLLSKHPRIATSQIAIMGFSKGGFVALRSSMKRFQRMYGTLNVEFAAYLPFYGGYCETPLLEDDTVSDRPIRMVQGEKDDFNLAEPCRKYIERLHAAGKDAQITIYPGARHAFDNPTYPAVLSYPDAVIPNRCKREERAGGDIYNADTGKPFTWKDACVIRGATVGFDPSAYAEAKKAVKAFLIETFMVTPKAAQAKE